MKCMIKDEINILNLMLDDMRQQEKTLRPGPYWNNTCNIIIQEIKKRGLRDFRGNSIITQGYGDESYMDPSIFLPKYQKLLFNNKIIRKVLQSYLLQNEAIYGAYMVFRNYYYQKRFNEWFNEISQRINIPDNINCGCKDVIDFNSRKISNNYLTMLRRIYNMSKVIDLSKVKRVLEIGGGFGSNAHLLLQLYPNIRKYLYLDIPPMIYVATQYLKQYYDESVIDYLKTRSLKMIAFAKDDSREIIALCPWQFNRVEYEYDLLWNACSFQEMETYTLEYYKQNIYRMTCENSQLVLLIYKGGNELITRSSNALTSLFSDNYKLKEIEPLIEDDENMRSFPKYYYGIRKNYDI